MRCKLCGSRLDFNTIYGGEEFQRSEYLVDKYKIKEDDIVLVYTCYSCKTTHGIIGDIVSDTVEPTGNAIAWTDYEPKETSCHECNNQMTYVEESKHGSIYYCKSCKVSKGVVSIK